MVFPPALDEAALAGVPHVALSSSPLSPWISSESPVEFRTARWTGHDQLEVTAHFRMVEVIVSKLDGGSSRTRPSERARMGAVRHSSPAGEARSGIPSGYNPDIAEQLPYLGFT